MPKFIENEITAAKGWATKHVVMLIVLAIILGMVIEGLAVR